MRKSSVGSISNLDFFKIIVLVLELMKFMSALKILV